MPHACPTTTPIAASARNDSMRDRRTSPACETSAGRAERSRSRCAVAIAASLGPRDSFATGAMTEPALREEPQERHQRRFTLRGRTLRAHAARGTLVNSSFLIALTSLGFLKGFALAGFLQRSDYGIWGVMIVTLNLVTRLQEAVIGDRYIQQDEEDQEAAFQKAFSLSVGLAAICVVAALIILPAFAAI